MRISDWSSDVCSSDLTPKRNQNDRSSSSPGATRRLSAKSSRSMASTADENGRSATTIDSSKLRRNERLSRLAVPMETMSSSRSEEHTSEHQSLMRISYAVFCLNKKTHDNHSTPPN